MKALEHIRLTDDEVAKLKANGLATLEHIDGNDDHVPVVRLFVPAGEAQWLLSEIDAENDDIAFGLCDLGVGCPELGTVSLSGLDGVRGPIGNPIERDPYFKPTNTISQYAKFADAAGRIVV